MTNIPPRPPNSQSSQLSQLNREHVSDMVVALNAGAHLRFTTVSTNVVLLQILYFDIFTGFVLRHETNH